MALSKQRVSKSPAAAPWEYDVFISFRGEDTRDSFTDVLYEKLVERAIKTFRDDHELERGTTISLKLLNAIEESWFAIIVLSPNYASSTWCLDELSHIVECMEDRKTILPIFYHVDPSHVRKQTGIFAQAFNKHEKTFMNDTEKVQRWRTALTKVGNMLGWISKDRYENDLIKEIVDTICHKVHPTCTLLGSRKKLVGIEFRLKKIDSLLDLEANDVRFIGIWGEGGTGKTTLARLVYEGISHNFEICRFIGNVKEVSAALQKVTQVWDAYSVSNMAKKCFCKKKVLLVIDEVEELNQMETLAGKKNWYGPGSRIIITTRNERLLVEYLIDKPYELLGLQENESSQLCHWKALKRDEPEEFYLTLTEKQLLDEESQYEDGHEQPAQLHLAEGESSSKMHPYQHYLTCVVCTNFVPEDLDGVTNHWEYRIWQEVYCPLHWGDGTLWCYSCGRFAPKDAKYMYLGDYLLCQQCQKLAIRSTYKCQSLYNEVEKFCHDLNMRLQIPVDLVDRRTVLIWRGLPRFVMGSSLAKVMMQAWIRINGYPNLRQEVQEGICLAFSRMWLESQQMHSRSSTDHVASSSSFVGSKQLSEFEKKLLEYRKRTIRLLEYGEASTVAIKAVRKHGLGSTLEHIRTTGNFPLVECYKQITMIAKPIFC